MWKLNGLSAYVPRPQAPPNVGRGLRTRLCIFYCACVHSQINIHVTDLGQYYLNVLVAIKHSSVSRVWRYQ